MQPQARSLPTPTSPIQTGVSVRGPVMWRAVPLEEADREFDFHYWQSQSPAARFDAAWELVETAWQIKGRPAHELRLQRSVIHFERLPG
jgi:hypothetical protein